MPQTKKCHQTSYLFSVQQIIYTVSQLNRETGALLGEHFLSIFVEGEISNLSIPASGHCYFTLKDANAQVRCAMFRGQRRQSFKPENGKQVVVKAQVSLYEPRGDYQLIVEYLEESGDGVLRRAFDALKLKLSEEGLFSAINKKDLPLLPKAIGVITSPSGAAIQDILTVLRRRFAAVPVIIYPVAVQGENAKFEIAKAIATANTLKQCDVLILARGGGSLEDLWAFNEEIVARAIYASQIPVISGVGHETDVTIADFVADLRAATPSAAAEHATPDQQQWLYKFNELETRLQQHLQRLLRQQLQKVDWLVGRLQQQHPQQKLTRNQQRLAELELNLKKAVQLRLTHNRRISEAQIARLWQQTPMSAIRRNQQQIAYLSERLVSATNIFLKNNSQRLLNASQTLHAVSPLATLNRGYALVTEQTSGLIVRSTEQLNVGDKVLTRLAKGYFTSQVNALFEE
ncbi:exodeoxyribonuclease VII large subunit [Methyloglobulus sp.]|uniref:exodeoxyribonuclease VII large subunit n=1 Tax=Methyloglobulus sp. TaxID=2518622 RepID=UPI0032B86C46